MKLLDPGCGEITDRLTILSLKILFGEQAGKEVSHFRTERAGLLTKIRCRDLNGAWFDKVLELAAVNSALWHKEDELRAIRMTQRVPETNPSAAMCAFQIQDLNDQRAKLVGEINSIAGDGNQKEKI